ncbi:MAG TPA: hypothetical protein VF475_14645 [Sphingobium sp.]
MIRMATEAEPAAFEAKIDAIAALIKDQLRQIASLESDAEALDVRLARPDLIEAIASVFPTFAAYLFAAPDEEPGDMRRYFEDGRAGVRRPASNTRSWMAWKAGRVRAVLEREEPSS